ncbi:DUF3429 domain-containing protein [Rhodotorula paludigena]|uniref:DUF3429 domain-containing protein n=1 Tax=Rhodotorula paludigena TaxID=86838 RepID=UPI003180BDA0
MLSTRLLARSAARQPRVLFASAGAAPSLRAPASRLFATSALRCAVDEVSKNPASKDLKHMGQNAAEEARGIARTLADAVAGQAVEQSSQRTGRENFGAGDIAADLDSVKSTLTAVPKEVIQWGAAGLLPYAGTGLAIVHFSRQAWLATLNGSEAGYDPAAAVALLEHAQLLQIQYGAIILSFLGAVHWGFEWAKYGGVKGNRRYLLGVAPVLVGWGSLLIPGQMALITQWGAFFAQWYADQKAGSKGWTPKWYATYRFWLTSVVGGSILVSLAAQGYYGSSREHAETDSQLKKLAEKKPPKPANPPGTSVELGDMKAEKATDAYVKFTNVEKEREKQKEEEEKKKQEEQEKRKEEKKENARQDDLTERVKKAEDK